MKINNNTDSDNNDTDTDTGRANTDIDMWAFLYYHLTKPSMHIKYTIHNFFSYILFDKEYDSLSYGLNHHHILTSSNYNAVETGFELLKFLRTNWRSWKVNFITYAVSITSSKKITIL